MISLVSVYYNQTCADFSRLARPPRANFTHIIGPFIQNEFLPANADCLIILNTLKYNDLHLFNGLLKKLVQCLLLISKRITFYNSEGVYP